MSPSSAKLRFSTLIVLPEDEEILDFTTGDKEFWVINGAHNLCYVHPAQAGIRSNLNLITASGHVYSFLLTEISNQPNARSRSQDLRRAQGRLRYRGEHGAARLCQRGRSPGVQEGTRNAPLPDRGADSRAAQAQAAEQVNQFPLQLRHETPIRLPTRPESRAASRSWSPPSTTTTPSPTSSAAHEKSPLFMKSRTASRT